MQCKDVESVLEQEGLSSLTDVASEHVAACASCQGFIADFHTIVSLAEKLPAEVEPPARIWVSLRSQLESEGVIREVLETKEAAASSPERTLEKTAWWQNFAGAFRGRVWATAAVGLVIVAAAIFQVLPSRHVRNAELATLSNTPAIIVNNDNDPFARTAQTLNQQEQDLADMHLAGTSPVDTSPVLRQNLKKLDEFIAECEHHLKEAPQDQLTREYLSSAYEQKAELLSEMLDRGRSVN